jgi:SAM-dependent methyltransferase
MTGLSLFKVNSVAHHYWEQLVRPGDLVVDATCGNGNDTLALARLVLTKNTGLVWAIDTQDLALTNTKKLLKQHLSEELLPRVHFIHGSHAQFPLEIQPNTITLIVYNLGYLPKSGKKEITTMVETTLQSLENALPLIKDQGAISITCYPGHPEGKLEEDALLTKLSTLSKDHWSCCYHRWLNHENAPSLILIQKRN